MLMYFVLLLLFLLPPVSSEEPLSRQKLSAHGIFQNSNVRPNAWILALAIKQVRCWDFPGGPVVRTLSFQCWGPGFDPWLGNWDSACCTSWPKISQLGQVFSLKWQSHFVHFLETVCQIPSFVEFVYQSFFHIKMLLLETAVIWYTAEMLRVHFTFCYIEYEKDSTERLGI